ncbi:Aspartic proteinase Asp1 [Dichanthelium oligosanthes]|uniref:Aspartic proteinase Asp1 n=1 Tax=Dichanthelium oligosanthes TaxID=888268 RepID=A0A1E5W6M0_9POAL|nr:Aspartic proteinase Asp1 [Dichanthelium oligosanthes]
MAARMAQAVGLLLLLALLPSTSSSGMVFHLVGDVYPTGHFHVTMHIGDPAKPYFLDIDTASSLTWVECNDVGKPNNCHTKAPQLCIYEIHYLEGSRSLGVLLRDKFTFPTGITHPDIAFGCGYDQGGNHKTVPVDGILGLGRGSVDLVSQLKSHRIITKNVIARCLSSKGGGYLSIGDENVLSLPVNWVPMAPQTHWIHSYYSPGRATLHLDTKSISASMEVVLDSGSTYTILPAHVYQNLVYALKASLRKSLKEVHDPSLPQIPCWKGPGVFKSLDDLKKEFKSVISLKFDHAATMMIPPEKFLIITGLGNACLGVHGMKDNDKYIIGDITMQDQLVIYDNERGRLAWQPSQCDKKPKSKSAIVSRI